MKIIPPGSVIGILGGGQLGRMTALAAARLGYRCCVYCPENDAPALDVSAMHIRGAFDDTAALERFASTVDVVTLEWENIPLEAVHLLEKHVAVHPGSQALRITQDRRHEKSFAREQGIGTASFSIIESEEGLKAALSALPGKGILKTARMGYDGHGQVEVTAASDPAQAWEAVGKVSSVLEGFVDFSAEVSVIVARRADGVMRAYTPVRNIHRDHILAETLVPAPLPIEALQEAGATALRLTEKMGIVGLLAVEMFVLKQPNAAGQTILMNEMAPRPHNSGHWTIDACPCSQFEQLVRAICGLPLGDTTPHARAVMRNLLGHDIDEWADILTDPRACLHLYGKKEIREGRKMGHVTFLSDKDA